MPESLVWERRSLLVSFTGILGEIWISADAIIPESVADYLKRPLYSVTGGELSTNVHRVEERLNKIFELTKRWNAVSLLDEADVLLCKRNSAEMDRNAVVAGTKNLALAPFFPPPGQC